MPKLETFDGDDLRTLGDGLRGLTGASDSMEDAANRVVSFLYDELEDDEGGPAAVLVRLYKTHPFGTLPPALQTFARAALEHEPEPEVRCLALLATHGELPAWNDAAQSVGHRAIPLPSREFVERLPMVAALVDQLGLGLDELVRPEPHRIVELSQRTYGVFHVPVALGSPFVPAQAEFVVPCGISSAFGFGGVLFTGDFFAVVVFSRVPVSAEVADRLRVLSLGVRVALLHFVNRVFAERPGG